MSGLSIFSIAFLVAMLSAALRFATPLLMAALGELYTERTGILNLGLEGVMLGGAFTGFLVMHVTESMLLAFLSALLIGIVLGLLLGFFYIGLKANQVVIGILFSLMMVRFTGYLYRLIFGEGVLARKALLQNFPIPLLSKIPYAGEIFFNQSPLTYLVILLVPCAYFILYRTGFGLKVRSVGEHPQAADTLGINVFRMRYIGMMIGCGMAGMAGAFFSLHFGSFLDTMLSGRGYIALAIVIFGQWSPYKALAGAVLFGFVDALALRLQALSIPIPFQFFLMLPYVLTIVALLVSVRSRGDVGSSNGPKALMQPYER